MSVTTTTTTRPTVLRRTTLVAGWSMIVLGVGHLVTFLASAGQDATTSRELKRLAEVQVAVPGLPHSLADLFLGFSLTMALLLVTVGALLVLVARHAAQAPGLLATVQLVVVTFAGVGLVLSWLYLPLPPVVGLSIALAAGLWGLVAARRTTAR